MALSGLVQTVPVVFFALPVVLLFQAPLVQRPGKLHARLYTGPLASTYNYAQPLRGPLRDSLGAHTFSLGDHRAASRPSLPALAKAAPLDKWRWFVAGVLAVLAMSALPKRSSMASSLNARRGGSTLVMDEGLSDRLATEAIAMPQRRRR